MKQPFVLFLYACLVLLVIFLLANQAAIAGSAEENMAAASAVVRNHPLVELAGVGHCDSLKTCNGIDPSVTEDVKLVRERYSTIWKSFRPKITNEIEEFLCQVDYGTPASGRPCRVEYADEYPYEK